MKTSQIRSPAGSYRLVDVKTFNHMHSVLEDYAERSDNSLIRMLLDYANEAEEVALEKNEKTD